MSLPARRTIPPHPSVAALLKAHRGATDAKALIRQLAQTKVEEARRWGWKGPSFCPRIFSSLFGIRCVEVAHDILGDGRILRLPTGRLRIEYRPGQLPERQRFTIFHEFAHTFFPDFGELIPERTQPPEDLEKQEKEFEFLCDVAAAEMLLPRAEFSRDLRKLAPACIESMHRLRGRYQASIDATIYRMTDLEERVPCAAVFLTDQRKKNFEGDGPLWVNNHSRNGRFNDFIWPGTIPPRGSLAFDCLRHGTDRPQAVAETWSIRGQPKTWLVQAAKLPVVPGQPTYSKVVVLLRTGC